MENHILNRAQIHNKRIDYNDRNITYYLRNKEISEITKGSDFLKNSRSESIKDNYHRYILKFGQILWNNLNEEQICEIQNQIKEIEQSSKQKLEEEKKIIASTLKERITNEIKEEKLSIESKWNIKLQTEVSKIEDEMLTRNEKALKEQKEKIVKYYEKKLQQMKKDMQQKNETEIEKIVLKTTINHQNEISELKKKHENEKRKLKESFVKEKAESLLSKEEEFTERIKEIESDIQEKYYKIYIEKLRLEEKKHIFTMEKLETQLYEKQLELEALQSVETELKNQQIKLKEQVKLIKCDFDHYIQTSMNLTSSLFGESFLLKSQPIKFENIHSLVEKIQENFVPLEDNPSNQSQMDIIKSTDTPKSCVRFTEDFL